MKEQIDRLWRAIKRIESRLTGSVGVPPSSHSTNHSSGGSDPVDVTDLDGFPGGSPITYLDSNGAFTSPSGSAGIDQLTGDVTAGPGSGSQAATIANDAVSNAKAANMAQATIKGRASGAGTGDPTDLTPDQASTILDAATDPFVRTSAAAAGYTDEQAQDAVGGILSDTGDVDFTYDDGAPSIVASLKTTSTPQVARLGIGTAADATAKLTVAGQFWVPLVDDGNSGASKTIDWNDGNEHLLTLTDDCAIDFSNPQDGGRYVLVLYTGAGGFAPTFPAEVLWPGGVAPTITAGAGKYDLITFIYLGGGSPVRYLASINQDY